MEALREIYPFLVETFNADLQKIKSIDELPNTRRLIRRVAEVFSIFPPQFRKIRSIESVKECYITMLLT